MITASVNGQSLNLPLDFSFDLIRESQITKHDSIKGDCIPSITFPDTERNRAVLFNPTLFELKRDGVKEFPNLELISDGFDIIRGTLVLNNGFSGFVRGAVGNISAQNADKLITDYDLPVDQEFQNKESYGPSEDDYDCPTIFNPDFFKDITKVTEWKIPNTERTYENTILQRYHRNRVYQINAKSEGLIEITTDKLYTDADKKNVPVDATNVISPFLYVFKILRFLLQYNGIYISKTEIQINNPLYAILLYNNTDINQKILTYNEITYENQLMGGNFTTTYGYNTFDQLVANFNYKDLLPPVSVKNFILGLQNLINIGIIFNDNSTAEIIDRENVLGKIPVSLDNFFTGVWELGEKKNVELHFTMQHDTGDALFGTYYQDLNDREDEFGDDVNAYSDLEAIESPTIGQLRRVLLENRIYEYKISTFVDPKSQREVEVVGWYIASIDFQTYKYNREEGVDKDVEEIKTTFSTLADKNTANVLQLGRCNLRRNQEANFTPRVFFNVDGYGKNNSTNYYLNWRGTNNLIETRWAKWAKFWANREAATGYFRLPAYMLQNFDMNRPYSTRQGSFIVDRMVTRITHAGIGETKAEVFKL